MVEHSDTKAWPFEKWLRLAVFHMHLSPQDFWNMDVKDWMALCRPVRSTGLTRAGFDALLRDFPDKEAHDEAE